MTRAPTGAKGKNKQVVLDRDFKPIPIVSIHATILVLVFAVASAYFLHIHATTEQMKMFAFQELGKINDLNFLGGYPRSITYVDTSLVTIDDSDPDYLIQRLEHVIYYSEKSAAEKGGEVLHILTTLTSIYPFRRAFEARSDGELFTFEFRPPENVVIDNVDDATQWAETVQRISEFFTEFLPREIGIEKFSTILGAFYETREANGTEYIERSRVHVTEMIREFQRANDIARSVSSHLNQIQLYKKTVPKMRLRCALLFSDILFLSGVIIPIMFSIYTQAPDWILKILVLWTPMISYMIAFTYIVVLLW